MILSVIGSDIKIWQTNIPYEKTETKLMKTGKQFKKYFCLNISI